MVGMNPDPIVLEVLTSPGCVSCHAFLEFWKVTSHEWSNVSMQEFSLTTIEGQELAGKHRVFALPGVIVSGEVFATGVVDTELFIETLKRLSGGGEQL